MTTHHSRGEHSDDNDILKQVERLLRSLPDEDDLIEHVAETFEEILADLKDMGEEGPTPLQNVVEWFYDTHLSPQMALAGDRREFAQRVEALIEAVIELGLVDLRGEGVVLDEIMLERPRVLGTEREGEWLDLRLADDQVSVTLALHNCLDLAHLTQALDEVSLDAAAQRDRRAARRRPRLVARAEAHYWAIWPGDDGMLELVFAETETNDSDPGQQRVRLVLGREDARLLAAALRLAG